MCAIGYRQKFKVHRVEVRIVSSQAIDKFQIRISDFEYNREHRIYFKMFYRSIEFLFPSH